MHAMNVCSDNRCAPVYQTHGGGPAHKHTATPGPLLACLPGLLKDACGLPFSCVLQPLAPPADGLPLFAAAGPAPLATLARCRHCYAYINSFCELTTSSFVCSLCGKPTGLGSQPALRQRYLKQPMARQLLPELACSVYEVDCREEDESAATGGALHGGSAGSRGNLQEAGSEAEAEGAGAAGPAYIALVDAAGDEDFLDLVRRFSWKMW